MSGSEPAEADGQAEEISVPLVAETARVGTRAVEAGRLRVTTRTDFVEETVTAKLASQDYEVVRVPVGRELGVEPVPVTRQDGDVTIVPILQEVLVVEKRLVLTEELHLRRRVQTEEVQVPITLRRQRAVVERVAAETTNEPEA